MLNEEKIRLMTKLSVYEEKDGREDIRLSKFYRSDYVRYQLLKTILCVTIAFLIIVGLIILYNTEFLIENALLLDYQGLITYGLTVYGLVLVIYIVFTMLLSSLRFRKSRKRLGTYYRGLKELEEIIAEEEKEKAALRQKDSAVDDIDQAWEDLR